MVSAVLGLDPNHDVLDAQILIGRNLLDFGFEPIRVVIILQRNGVANGAIDRPRIAASLDTGGVEPLDLCDDLVNRPPPVFQASA